MALTPPAAKAMHPKAIHLTATVVTLMWEAQRSTQSQLTTTRIVLSSMRRSQEAIGRKDKTGQDKAILLLMLWKQDRTKQDKKTRQHKSRIKIKERKQDRTKIYKEKARKQYKTNRRGKLDS